MALIEIDYAETYANERTVNAFCSIPIRDEESKSRSQSSLKEEHQKPAMRQADTVGRQPSSSS